jgi:hypothetical protein
MWAAGGVLAFGAFLDAIFNAIAFFNVERALAATAGTIALWWIVQVLLSRYNIRVSSGQSSFGISRLGRRYGWALVGAVVLIWVSTSLNLIRKKPAVPSALPGTCLLPRHLVVEMKQLADTTHAVTAGYPYFAAPCSHAGLDAANASITKSLESKISEFRAAEMDARNMARRAGPSEDPDEVNWAEMPYGPNGVFLKIDCRARLATASLLSVLCTQAHYLPMAAHQTDDTTALNFEIDSTAANPFGLDDVLVGGAFAHQRLVELIRVALEAQNAKKWDLSDGHYLWLNIVQGFGLTEQGAAFWLGDYATGPYVDGAREVVVPYTSLGGVFRSNGPHARLETK